MRLRKEHGVIDKLMEHPDLCLIQNDVIEQVDWEKTFGNTQPIHAEIGMGKGQFIIEKALKYPNVNFVGIELREQVLLRAVKKASEHNLNNLRFLLTNANNLTDIFKENSLDKIYLNFSDPWPKKRHYKRRLTYRDFIKIYNLILKEDSWVEFKTDNLILFQFTLNELAELQLPMKLITLDLHQDDRFEGNIMTEYEEKFSNRGSKIMSVSFMTHR